MSVKKLLIVDDDADLLRGMSASLTAAGYEVASATDGVSAMSAARQEQPDLIVLDIGLPAGNGFQVMEWLTSLNRQIPVIVVSARQAEPNQTLALEAGALAFFQKPVDRAEFMAAVQSATADGRFDAGGPKKRSIAPREVFLDDVVAEALAASRGRATAAGVVCQVEIPPGLPPAFADPDRTLQVLVRLIDSSIKVTAPAGVIVVGVRLDDNDDFLLISVGDSGRGLTLEDRSRIVELVALQGGRIHVTGEGGQDATCSFTLPIFSLRGLCAPILTPSHLRVGAMAVITVETCPDDESAETKAARLILLGAALERCIVAGQAVVLPRMFGPKSPEPFFIVANTDETGAGVIERDIHRALQRLPGPPPAHPPTVSITMVRWPPTQAQTDFKQTVTNVVARLHELVTATVLAQR